MTERETYTHILQTASMLFAENGFAGTSMNDIVKASGLSKGGIYWHFKSKDDIIFAIIESIYTEQTEALNSVLNVEGQASQKLKNLVDLIAQSLNDGVEGIPSPIDIYALALRKPDLLAHIKQFLQRYQAHFTQLLQEGIQQGEFILDDPDTTAFVFMSTIEGIILVSAITETNEQLAHTLQQATEIFLRGIQLT